MSAQFWLTAIAEHARLNPEKIALASETGEISYAELERRASQLSQHFHLLGLGPETLAAICLGRSPDFVIAALAILKCGAAYLPIDPAHPTERLHFILRDSGAAMLITRDEFAGRFSNLKIKQVKLDAIAGDLSTESAQPPLIEPSPDQLAYVIYTSGSTGEPKGVEITHRNLSNLIAWHIEAFNVNGTDRATFQAGVGFDAAVWEIWPHLFARATLVLPNESTRLSAELLRDWFVREKITISFVPTAIAEQLLGLEWPRETALRFMLTGADTLHRRPPENLPFAFVNNYGPTECTVVATSGIVAPEKEANGSPSIGSPIKNARIEIREGEIFIGGAGVARGYRNRPQLTSERFVGEGAERFYRTGDLGKFLPNGEIEFFGRADDQVKIRGYRIELGEINAALKKHSAIESSVVVAREDEGGEKRLVAYLVAKNGALPNEQTLRESLRRQLPDYMEPAAFVWLEALPLTPNGKIDRAALPVPSFDNGNRENFVEPKTVVEKRLAEIIQEVLKIPRVSVDDDFFHLGAHSLLGAQIIARVRQVFGAELKLLDVFDAPTVAQLSEKIEETLTRQLSEMSEADVEAALANFNENAAA